MVNKVFLEGQVVRSTWGEARDSGFFVTIKQERKIGKFTYTDYFSLYANRPLAAELAKLIDISKDKIISIEGALKTYRAKNGEWKTTIQVEKIIK